MHPTIVWACSGLPHKFSIYSQEVLDSVLYAIGSCKMIFALNYLVYSVDYIAISFHNNHPLPLSSALGISSIIIRLGGQQLLR